MTCPKCGAATDCAEPNGFHVERYGGGRFTSVAWCLHRCEAEKEVARIKLVGRWNGMPPRVTVGRDLNERGGGA